MASLRTDIIKAIRLRISYLLSYIASFIVQKEYKNVSHFCMFIGYPRSGHSLVASLLDAHPNIVMGMEWGALTHFEFGFRKKQIFYLLAKNATVYNKKFKNIWTGYSYFVPGGHQGRTKKIEVIGDKLGGLTSIILHKKPQLLDQFSDHLKLKLLLIHVIRNPFDIITTSTIRFFERNYPLRIPQADDLLPFIQKFFLRSDTVMHLKSQTNYKIVDIFHEELVANPEKELKRIIEGLSLDAEDKYYKMCSKIVYETPHKSRHRIQWPEEFILYVERRMSHYPFLKHYSYSD